MSTRLGNTHAVTDTFGPTRPGIEPWTVRAVNLPEHGDNPVHTDAGARAAGHERALVAGTTVYVYLTHAPLSAWGLDWARAGGGEVRFRSPVFDDDIVEVRSSGDSPGGDVSASPHRVEAVSRNARRATFDVWRDAPPPAPMRGDELPPFAAPLDDGLAGYALRAGDHTEIVDPHRGDDSTDRVVHPAVTAILGNRAMIASVVNGPWIHVRSHVTHLGLATPGDVAVVESSLASRFGSRAGERVILDVRVSVNERPIWAIEHEAIVRLA